MKSGIVFLIAFVCMLYFNSCKKKDQCISHEIVTNSLESVYGCENTDYELNINLIDTFTIISTQQDFENRVTGSCIPKIDFAKFDLLIGKKVFNSGISSISYKMIQDCSNDLLLIVTFQMNAASFCPNATYHVLMPKIKNEQEVRVEIRERF